MATEEESLRSEVIELLKQLGIQDITVQVETYNPGATKTHIELRNYNKLMTDFFMALPNGMRSQEIDILRTKAERGVELDDSIKESDIRSDGQQGEDV